MARGRLVWGRRPWRAERALVAAVLGEEINCALHNFLGVRFRSMVKNPCHAAPLVSRSAGSSAA